MKRVTTITYSEREAAALARCERARAAKERADRELASAIRSAVAWQLPVRVIGEAAGCSGAHVSRLANGHYGR